MYYRNSTELSQFNTKKIPYFDLWLMSESNLAPINTLSFAMYGKCSQISNTFHFLNSKKMRFISPGIHQILVRIANREDPDQTASSEAV